MRRSNINLMLLGNPLLASVALVALIALTLNELAPGISLGELFLYCVVGPAGALALLVGITVCVLQFSQLILRNGGTDAQRFWFSGKPRGLAALRKGQSVDEDAR